MEIKYFSLIILQVKVKVIRYRRAGAKDERIYRFDSFLTSELDRCVLPASLPGRSSPLVPID
jgi:hypothetical protein